MHTLKNRKNFRENYNSTIFTKIYKTNGWGGKHGELYSGSGSYNEMINGYVKSVSEFAIKYQLKDIVELGCGDFNVSGKILKYLDEAGFMYNYTGYDVVKPLIKKNNELFGNDKIKFFCKDGSSGIIKPGGILIIRQVLQHLNNRAIYQITKKFDNYSYIVVSEHQPSERYAGSIKPNIDKQTNGSIRLPMHSGVYLDKSPFNCTILELLNSIPESVHGRDAAINTFIVKGK
jgi:hypothetical protein